MDLVTYDDLKALLKLAGSDISEYPELELIRDSVKSAIENFIGRELESTERTESFYLSSQSQMIKLSAIPISEISELTIDGTDADYTITRYGILLDAIPDLNGLFSCTYTGGYNTIPSDISRAALLQTAYEFQGKTHIGVETISNEGGSVTRPELGLLKEVKRLLQPYKHPLLIR